MILNVDRDYRQLPLLRYSANLYDLMSCLMFESYDYCRYQSYFGNHYYQLMMTLNVKGKFQDYHLCQHPLPLGMLMVWLTVWLTLPYFYLMELRKKDHLCFVSFL